MGKEHFLSVRKKEQEDFSKKVAEFGQKPYGFRLVLMDPLVSKFVVRPLLLLGLLLLGLGPWSAAAEELPETEEPNPSLEAWQQTSRFLFQDAHDTFAKIASKDDSSRADRLGVAVTRLGLQPRTQRNIQLATAELEALIAENPDDNFGMMAKFYLARTYEMHQANPDPEAARQLYWEILQQRPGIAVLEQGASRIALLDLYAAGHDPEALRETAINLGSLAEYLQTPAGQREFHTTMGMTVSELGGDFALALEHMKKAVAIPNPLPQMQSTNILVTAELAKSVGDLKTAREFYQKFVDEFRRDSRNYSVRRLLEDLPEDNHGTDS
jgi:tetratricopeptide (TPR) repeat protein